MIHSIKSAVDHIPNTIQTTLNVAAPVTALGYLVDVIPTIALVLAALWSLLQIVNFVMSHGWMKWEIFNRRKKKRK